MGADGTQEVLECIEMDQCTANATSEQAVNKQRAVQASDTARRASTPVSILRKASLLATLSYTLVHTSLSSLVPRPAPFSVTPHELSLSFV